ncbi:MAG: hypothetical protein JRM97_09460, partial [Nitrososphaerota archaeon]|nr:hypothetical protein [Nitrososphaerota archaeon]
MKIPRIRNGVVFIWLTPLSSTEAYIRFRDGKIDSYSLSYIAGQIGVENLLKMDYEYVETIPGVKWKTVYAVFRYARI